MVIVTTPEILPREYGVAVISGINKTFYFPNKFARALVLKERPSLLKNFLRDLQTSVQNEKYKLVFPEIDDYLFKEEIAQLLEEGIKKKHNTYNLWRVHDSNAVRKYKEYGDSVTAEVKSMTHGREKGAYREVKIVNPGFMGAGLVRDLFSPSSDESVVVIKEPGRVVRSKAAEKTHNNRIVDVYLAALQTEYSIRKHRIPYRVLPYNFLTRVELVMEVLLSYYVGKMSLYEIDKRLLGIPEIINKSLIETVQRGRGVVETERQKYKEIEIDDKNVGIYWAVIDLMNQIERGLEKKGYKRNGIAVEFKDSEWEKICINYETESDLIRVLFNDGFLKKEKKPPILVVHRKFTDEKEFDFFRQEKYEEPPEALIGKRQRRIDERTKKMTTMRVYSPAEKRDLKVPSVLMPFYRN